jgi:hypothetical protein
MGVAFVAATLGLGVCFGMNFSKIKLGPRGPDLSGILKGLECDQIPPDVREECLNGILPSEQPKAGDWIAIWGGAL